MNAKFVANLFHNLLFLNAIIFYILVIFTYWLFYILVIICQILHNPRYQWAILSFSILPNFGLEFGRVVDIDMMKHKNHHDISYKKSCVRWFTLQLTLGRTIDGKIVQSDLIWCLVMKKRCIIL